MTPRHPIISIERQAFAEATPSPSYAYSIPLFHEDECLRAIQEDTLKVQIKMETEQLNREIDETVGGTLPRNPRVRKRRLLFASDPEEADARIDEESNNQSPSRRVPVDGEMTDDDDQVFLRRQRPRVTDDSPNPSDTTTFRRIPTETDAELSVASPDRRFSPRGANARPAAYNLRQRQTPPVSVRSRSESLVLPPPPPESDEDQVYRPSFVGDHRIRPGAIRTRSQRLLGDTSSEETLDSPQDPLQEPNYYSNVFSRRERGYLPYLPQIYDTITYIREGHERFLDKVPLEHHPDYHQTVTGHQASHRRRSSRSVSNPNASAVSDGKFFSLMWL